MNWDRYHTQSERLAAEAELARRSADPRQAEELYRQAASAEAQALEHVPSDKVRTRGITAISAVALWYKGREYARAERLAYHYLAAGELPRFAEAQLRELLNVIWSAEAAQTVGVRFVPGDVFVSVKGGQVIHGGAPLDLIVRKVEGIQAVLFRTVEMLLDRPFRRHGAPAADIQAMFRPWLFQAPAGSYQFAVRVQEPEQRELWEVDRPRIDALTSTFFSILRAAATDPETKLASIVADAQYLEAFLGLSRNLAPTGKTFELLEVRDAGSPADPVASFAVDTRQQINTALRKVRPPRPPASTEEPVTLRGILRAVHLDEDWLEIVPEVPSQDSASPNIRVEDAVEALDDVVGPMVNRKVILSAVRRGQRYLYRDIEPDE
jgi:hypothetical protein